MLKKKQERGKYYVINNDVYHESCDEILESYEGYENFESFIDWEKFYDQCDCDCYECLNGLVICE